MVQKYKEAYVMLLFEGLIFICTISSGRLLLGGDVSLTVSAQIRYVGMIRGAGCSRFSFSENRGQQDYCDEKCVVYKSFIPSCLLNPLEVSPFQSHKSAPNPFNRNSKKPCALLHVALLYNRSYAPGPNPLYLSIFLLDSSRIGLEKRATKYDRERRKEKRK